jgi:cytochrome b involved in lipid metabolism
MKTKFETVEEVAAFSEQHHKQLVVFQNKVLDVSSFKHPGP